MPSNNLRVDPKVKTEEEVKDPVATKYEGLFTAYQNRRAKYTRQWYINDNFFDGNHFVFFRKSTGTIDHVAPPKGSIFRSVPKASKQVEAIQNLVLANEPRWIVYPAPDQAGQVSKEALEGSRRSSHYLVDVFDEQGMLLKTAELVLYAFKQPYSAFEVADDPKKMVDIRSWDAYDIVFDTTVKDIEDAPVVIKLVRKTVTDLQSNTNYTNTENLSPDARQSLEPMKDLRLTEKHGSGVATDDDTGGVNVMECWAKCHLTEDKLAEIAETENNDWVSKKKVGDVIMRLTTCASGFVLRDEYIDRDDYPFVIYKPKSGSFLQPAWIERFISQNKSLDMFVSNIEMYTALMVKGKWLKNKLSNVTRINNEHGDFIEYDVTPPEQARIQSIPAYVFQHIANLEKWIEEQGVSTAAMGRVPRGVRAYKAIESLKQSDIANLGVAMKALEEVIKKVGEKVAAAASRSVKTPTTIYRMNGDKPDYFQIIGSEAAKNSKKYQKLVDEGKLVVIDKNIRLKVAIESGLAYTEEGKRATMMELYGMKVIPAEMLLETLKFSNVGEIIAKVESEMVRKETMGKSIIDMPEFKLMPQQLQKIIVQFLRQASETPEFQEALAKAGSLRENKNIGGGGNTQPPRMEKQ